MITLSNAASNAACAAVVTLVDQGSDRGKLLLMEGFIVLATVLLSKPAFTAPVDGAAEAIGSDGVLPIGPSNPLFDIADIAGVADNYAVVDSNANIIWSGEVTGVGDDGDLKVDDVNIIDGQQVRIIAWTHKH